MEDLVSPLKDSHCQNEIASSSRGWRLGGWKGTNQTERMSEWSMKNWGERSMKKWGENGGRLGRWKWDQNVLTCGIYFQSPMPAQKYTN